MSGGIRIRRLVRESGVALVNLRQLLSDDELRAELMDRLGEVLPVSDGGLQGLDSDLLVAALADDLTKAAEGLDDGLVDIDGLEAIVRPFTRPVFFVQDLQLAPGIANAAVSEVWQARLGKAKDGLQAATPAVGRVELRNHRQSWVGTGWMVAPDVAVTNAHVAESFAQRDADFGFRPTRDGRLVHASLDWRREYGRPAEAYAQVAQVLWISPDQGFDVAFLRVEPAGAPLPTPIPLMSAAEVADALNDWVAVIGYPQRSLDNDLEDQQRIFDGVYGVKRLAPGAVMSIEPDGVFHHDATTLGGNSGSVVLHLETGKAVGLHFGGFEGDRNDAVQAHVVADLLAQHGQG